MVSALASRVGKVTEALKTPEEHRGTRTPLNSQDVNISNWTVVRWIVWDIYQILLCRFYPGIEHFTFFILPHANSKQQQGTT